MTDKELAQIEAWLDGQGRYKLFDTERLSILRELDGNEFKVWFYLWTQERGRQESWVKNGTIAKETGVSLSTVKRVRKRLIGNKWVVYTGSTAADNYDKPTAGARLVRSVRVDDPSKGQIDPLGQNEPEGVNLNRVNLNPNIATVSAFASTGEPARTCARVHAHAPATPLSPPLEAKTETEKQKQRPPDEPGMAPVADATPAPKPKTRSSADKFREKYGVDKPDWFDINPTSAKTQARRTEWILAHDPANKQAIEQAREIGRPLSYDPGESKFTCPVTGCDHGKANGAFRSSKKAWVISHIREKHPEHTFDPESLVATVETPMDTHPRYAPTPSRGHVTLEELENQE